MAHLNRSLHEAIEQNDSSAVSEILSDPSVDVNVRNNDGSPALHVALGLKRWDIVSVLINNGADINSDTLLTHVVQILDDVPPDVLALLISPHIVNTVIDTSNGNTLLHEVLIRPMWNLVPVLIDKGADIDVHNNKGQTPLHLAVLSKCDSLDVLTRLISSYNINAQDSVGETALHLVIKVGLDKLGSYMLNNRTSPKVRDRALMLRQLSNTIRQLVDLWAQHINIEVGTNHSTNDGPLHLTLFTGVPKRVVAKLISHKNINMTNVYGETPLMIAVLLRLDLVELLLQYGADPTVLSCWPAQPFPPSLQQQTSTTIRRHMPVISDEAFAALPLPRKLRDYIQQNPLAEEILEYYRSNS